MSNDSNKFIKPLGALMNINLSAEPFIAMKLLHAVGPRRHLGAYQLLQHLEHNSGVRGN